MVASEGIYAQKMGKNTSKCLIGTAKILTVLVLCIFLRLRKSCNPVADLFIKVFEHRYLKRKSGILLLQFVPAPTTVFLIILCSYQKV